MSEGSFNTSQSATFPLISKWLKKKFLFFFWFFYFWFWFFLIFSDFLSIYSLRDFDLRYISQRIGQRLPGFSGINFSLIVFLFSAVKKLDKCRCKFVWCCNVVCDKCESQHEVHTCKWKKNRKSCKRPASGRDCRSRLSPVCLHAPGFVRNLSPSLSALQCKEPAVWCPAPGEHPLVTGEHPLVTGGRTRCAGITAAARNIRLRNASTESGLSLNELVLHTCTVC